MDGNGRWAKERGLIRTKGHEKGADTIRDITQYCAEHETIKTVTLYAFSTENWKRPKYEVDFLMRLLDRWLKQELVTYHRFGARFETVGNIEGFSKKLQKTIASIKEQTAHHTNVTQVLALNYGSREEIAKAAQRLANREETITEESLGNELNTPYQDIDLLVRTSGEQRLSNFLLWQLSYSEFFFTPTLWPDFTPNELDDIVDQYVNRNRRFGGL
ncbi:MAG TPA: di-trans,poly-cis-decaprenylcistransferase [Campylobacterales bacterium]|nr:di-trans,poly-cis-decaprenylcistransferase [Campylobacterales bacterium]HIP42287.1 di-trans,poly-cis-decaprenylcistransferase [Campylobacterales bacterium]